MGFGLLIVGIILIVAAYQGSHKELFELLRGDLTGSGNFVVWVVAFVILVGLGNIRSIKPVSDAFIVLVIIALILANYRNKDLLGSFIQQVKGATNG